LQPVTVVLGPFSIVTTGSFTYAEYRWQMGGCLEFESAGPVTREGTNFSCNFDIAMQTNVACPDDIFTESAIVVLGALPPGAYALTTTSWEASVGTNTFVVPADSPPTIQPLGFGADGSFQLLLNGVTNVTYVLQSSTNLVNWTSLSTNVVGQPLTDPSPAGSGCRFYRAQAPQITVGLWADAGG
jgi:hypothetical protein